MPKEWEMILPKQVILYPTGRNNRKDRPKATSMDGILGMRWEMGLNRKVLERQRKLATEDNWIHLNGCRQLRKHSMTCYAKINNFHFNSYYNFAILTRRSVYFSRRTLSLFYRCAVH